VFYSAHAERYEDAAQQFRDDVAVNPADTEEAIWAFLSEAKLIGASKARQQFLQVGLFIIHFEGYVKERSSAIPR
jgi:hypothetical protein